MSAVLKDLAGLRNVVVAATAADGFSLSEI